MLTTKQFNPLDIMANVIPVFNNLSSMHRVFGDPVESTDIRLQENVLSAALLSHRGVEIRVRKWFSKTVCTPQGEIIRRFECYYDGILVDYTTEGRLIVKTFRWLSGKGLISKLPHYEKAI